MEKRTDFRLKAFVLVALAVALQARSALADTCPIDIAERTPDGPHDYVIYVGQNAERSAHETAVCVAERYVTAGGVVTETPALLVGYSTRRPGGDCVSDAYVSTADRNGFDRLEILLGSALAVLSVRSSRISCWNEADLGTGIFGSDLAGSVTLEPIRAGVTAAVYAPDDRTPMAGTLETDWCPIDADVSSVYYGKGYAYDPDAETYTDMNVMYVCTANGVECAFLDSDLTATSDEVFIDAFSYNEEVNYIYIPTAYFYCQDDYWGRELVVRGWNGVEWQAHMNIQAGVENDHIWGSPEDDELWGDEDFDTIYGEDGNDTMLGGDGLDLLYGGSGADSIDGGNGADRIYGQTGSDTLRGQAGDDSVLDGGDGNNDRVYGGDGDDSLFGGAGSGDSCDGDGEIASDYCAASPSCETRTDCEAP